jgi:hypothetical protein
VAKIAREDLIQRRDTHLDQLTDKLREPRVHRVISALLSTGSTGKELPNDDVQYVADLGLITTHPALRIANPIYQEIIPRELVWGTQVTISNETHWYVQSGHRLDIPKLLRAFQQFFREHSEAWIERFDYKEAGPQLLLQAFLQRIINGGGRITREYGLGRKRTDLFIEWPLDEQQGYYGPVQRVVLELKILHKSLTTTLAEALPQTSAYADKCGAGEAHVLIFNRDPGVDWVEKLWEREEIYQGKSLGVWGL